LTAQDWDEDEYTGFGITFERVADAGSTPRRWSPATPGLTASPGCSPACGLLTRTRSAT
jgi:hypothetical protein